jgi:CoA:oxalate CoA-transferase
MRQPLADIQVLDLSRVLAGPYCTMILANLGAGIIKVERAGEGDDARSYTPFVEPGDSAYFASINRGKRSIELDLKLEKDKDVFWQLVGKCDVIIENFRPGTMEKLGLGYEEIKKRNPSMVYAAISGFGHTGPYSQRAAYDMIVQAMGGIMSITGEPGMPPVRVGTSVGDITAGLFGAIGILAALRARDEAGLGQKVDLAMLDCQAAILESAITRFDMTGKVPQPMGSRHPSIAPFQAFPSKDSYVVIAGGNDSLWKKICQAMGIEQYIDDPRFLHNKDRVENMAELEEAFSAVTIGKTTAEWLEIMDEAGVPAAPVNTMADVIEDEQLLARDMIVSVGHPNGRTLRFAGNPIKLSDTPPILHTQTPKLGQHTAEMLRDNLGGDEERIREYMEDRL